MDVRHPKVVALMQELIDVQGHARFQLGDILTGAGIRLYDLPKLPVGLGGEMRPVCWAWVLGGCTFPGCKFVEYGHVPREKMTDEFAEEVVRLLKPGVAVCVQKARERKRGQEGGSPGKKQKVAEGDEE